MSTIAPVQVSTPYDGPGCQVWVWKNAGSSDTLLPLVCGAGSDKTVAFVKGSGFGGNASLTGSLDPSLAAGSFCALTNSARTAISAISSDTLSEVLQDVYALLPVLAASASGVSIWVKLSHIQEYMP